MPEDANRPLVEGLDYTVTNGLLTFTRSYLLRRGTCCQNGCQHCPYGFCKPQTKTDESDRPR